MKKVFSLAIICLMAAPASAITVDGTRDAGYGPALRVQTVQTQFGDEGNGCVECGGELDAAYAVIENGRLFVMLTGNIETDNFNKMEVFIDSVPGGENTLSGTPEYDFSNQSQNLAGLTFDAGIEIDYHLFARGGFGSTVFDVDFINRAGGGSASVAGNGKRATLSGASGTATDSIGPGDPPEFGNISGDALTQSLDFGFNNSNAAGVMGGTGAADQAVAAAVTTGLEFSIDLVDLGSPAVGDTIHIVAAYNNDSHGFLSNQTLGGLPAGTSNLGGPGSVNFSNIAGDQFFSIVVPVPEPASLALIGLASMGLLSMRRRS